MSMDKSLENLNIAKLLVYTLSFLFICAVLILFLLVPNFTEYKLLKTRLNNQLEHNQKVRNELNKVLADVKKLERDNYYSFKQYNTLFNQEDLKHFLEKYLRKVKLKPLKADKELYLGYLFEVEAVIKKPDEFLSFIKEAYKNKNLLKIDFPVIMSINRENKLNLSFKIKVYSLLE